MIASTTQERLSKINQAITTAPLHCLLRTLSTLEPEEFNNYIQHEYGAIWGTLKFDDSPADFCNEPRPFLYVDGNIVDNLSVLRQFMINEWKLQSANIVIPILSAITNHKPFKSLKMIEKLKSGIRNAANASEVWFITNGLDAGMPQLIGAAFRDEINRRRADLAWAKQMGREPKEVKPLILLGIVCDDEIKDIMDLRTVQDKTKMKVKVPTRKPDQLSLNSDHTHFIIIREEYIGMSSKNISELKSMIDLSGENQLEKLTDAAQSATNRFRDQFEYFLYQGTSQSSTQMTSPTNSLPPATTTTVSTVAKKESPWGEMGFPMVCTVVRGTPGTIELLHKKIQQEIPAVILKGTGSAADIISFAYEEFSAKNDKDYVDNYLKVEITRNLLNEYPLLKDNHMKRNEVRDYILSIVKNADKGKQKLLAFLDINSTTPPLSDFHQFILSTLLQSQKTLIEKKVNVQLRRNLLLTFDWNLPDLARSEIFQRDDMKYSIQSDLFDKALLEKKREPFVDLFLDQEFVLHRYLKSDKLVSLFNETKDREFLTTTSLEGILGLTGDEEEMPPDFVKKGLNDIMKRLTGMDHFFSKHEIDCNAMGIYFGDKSDKGVQRQRARAEKKALRHLVVYAILINRHDLAKILWKHSSEPIPLALICSMMYKKLAPYCHEPYQRSSIQKQAKEFSEYAVAMLDKAFNEDDARTSEMLDEKHPDWNDMTTVELAYNAKNKAFMAHAACQKWVTKRFYGDITPRDLPWGLFKCSDYWKIILSAILIFPMWFWINFSPIGQAKQSAKKSNDVPSEKKEVVQLEEGTQSAKQTNSVSFRQANSIFQRIRRCFSRQNFKNKKSSSRSVKSDEPSMGPLKKIGVLWAAPITKFYVNFMAYIVFLAFFTLAVMWPSCGNLFLDSFVWFWAASIAFENTRAAYEKYCSQSSLPLHQAVLEVFVQTIFLSLYLVVRIIGLWNFGTCRILTAKAILGLGLIYYYYRILFIYFPISSKLGPLMIRLRYMVMYDFFTFLQLFVIFMISSGVAITAVVYPHYPLGLDLFGKAFVIRGLMALFSSEMRDFRNEHGTCTVNATSTNDSEYACLRLSNGLSFKYDNAHAYNRYGISKPDCHQTSWIAWFLLIQYFFLAKRFLTSLLTAMFGLTGARVQSQSEQIWMYNNYEIVMEYAKRPRLPPPFTVISYISMLINSCRRQYQSKVKGHSDKKCNSFTRSRSMIDKQQNNEDPGGVSALVAPLVHDRDNNNISNESPTNRNADRSVLRRLFNCKPCKQGSDTEKETNDQTKENVDDNDANLYWQCIAKEYYTKTQEVDKTQDKLDNVFNNVASSRKEIDVLKKSVRQINDRVVTLEKLMIDSHILLEKIQAAIQREDKSLPECENFIHILSRKSPYVYTNEARFAVTERYIPWRIPFDLYDPTVIILPKEHYCFRDDERAFVEQDLLKSSTDEKRDGQTQVAVDVSIPPQTPIFQTGVFGAFESPDLPTTTRFTIPVLEPKWNEVVEYQLTDGKKIILDRTTWVLKPGGQTSVYRLDTQLLLPLNPMGRTGVRGRGALIRWGPNKSIIAIITRWKKYRGQFAIIDGQRILEALVFKDKHSNDWKLPGGKILGVESAYGAVCRSFNKLAMHDDDTEHSFALQEQDMIEYFQAFAGSNVTTIHQDRFESHMVYRGYIDDVRNTDNAWVEAEIWNFHYGSSISLPTNMGLWKDVTHNSRGFSMQTSIFSEIARLHDAYFE